MTTTKLTPLQADMLAFFRKEFGFKRKAKGLIPHRQVECMHQRPFWALVNKGYIQLIVAWGDHSVQYKLTDKE